MAVERYRVQVDGKWMDLTIEGTGAGVRVQSGDKTWDADLRLYSDTNLLSVLLGGRSLEFLVEKVDDTYTVLRGTEQYQVRVRPAWAAARGRAAGEGEADGEVSIESPLVGVIASVFVTRGQQVQRGDLLLIVEAMKMQNEIRAPRAGVVRAVRVKQGQKVSRRQPLLSLV